MKNKRKKGKKGRNERKERRRKKSIFAVKSREIEAIV